MPEDQSLSKQSESEEEAAAQETPIAATDSRRKKSASKRNRRLNSLFSALDQESIDPDAELAPEPQSPGTPAEVPAARTQVDEPFESLSIPQSEPTEFEPEGSEFIEYSADAPRQLEALPEEFTPPISPEPIPSPEPEPSAPAPTTDITPDEPVDYPPPDDEIIEPQPASKPTPTEKFTSTVRPFTTQWSKSFGYVAEPDQHSEDQEEEVRPSEKILTKFGWESLLQGELVKGKNTDLSSTIAYAIPFSDSSSEQPILSPDEKAALLLEIIDENPNRQWSEDELLLVEQVADQLSLALENARLFEEARTRSEYLVILNEMSQMLSTQLNSDDVIDTVYRYTTKLLDTTNFYIALYDEEKQEVSFPYTIEAHERVVGGVRWASQGLTDYIFQTRQTILIRDNVSGWVKKHLANDINVEELASWLGAPMIFGDQVIGAIAVQSYAQPKAFDENDRDLLNAVATQAAVALLNARLFEQTQTALSALEVSEMYQKGVAQAVSILTERGISALTDVLKTLGQAANASRVYTMETQVDARGSFWRMNAEWQATGVRSQFGNPLFQHMPTMMIAPWLEELRSQGWVVVKPETSPPELKKILDSTGAKSQILFAVVGRHALPGCIGFEQTDYERSWKEDERSALQTAASALANTIAREDLFTQVQINLAETEALYQASARLNSAASYEDILTVLRQHTLLGHINASNITLNLFDHPWFYQSNMELGERPNWLIPLARWFARQPSSPPADRYPLDSWPTIDTLLHPEIPAAITDIETDDRIDEVGRKIYLEQMGAKSLLYVPLNVAGQWIGHIIGVYIQTTGFPEQDLRRLTSLAGQAAVAIAGLRSLEETRQRNEELATLNQITAAASETLDIKEVMDEILTRVLSSTGYNRGLISILDSSKRKLTLAVHQNLPNPMVQKLTSQGMEGTPCDLVYRLKRTIHISDLNRIAEVAPDMVEWQEIFNAPQRLGFNAYLGVPLESKGQVLGTVCIFSDQIKPIDPNRITLLQAVGQQVGVVVENAELFQETQVALSETEILYQAGAKLTSVQSYDDVLSIIRRYTVIGEADSLAHIMLFNRPCNLDDLPEFGIPIAAWSSIPDENLLSRLDLTKYLIANTLSPSEPTIFENLTDDQRLDENSRQMYTHTYQAKSAIFIPLSAGGDWIGYINGAYGEMREFGGGEIRRLITLAGQATIAILNLRLFEETRRRANQLQTAAEIARDTSSTLTLGALLSRAVNLLCDRFGYYHASIFLLDDTGERAVVHESTGKAGEEMKRYRHCLPVKGPSVIGQVTGRGEPLVLNDVTQEDAYVQYRPNPLLPDTRSELGIPLQIGDRVIGALDVQSDQTDAFSEDDIAVLQTLADQIAVAVDNARSYELAQQAMEEIREADRLKSQFLANMSHELRTPLNSIIGFSRVIIKGIDGPINDLQQQDLTAIYNSGQHLLGLINDVLDLSKIEAGKMDLVFENNVDLSEIINGVLSTTAGLVKDKPVALHQEIDQSIPLIRMDPMKVRQVLLNLLSNAAKFTEEGSITVIAGLQDGPEGELEVLISVKDTGPGIAPEDQVKLFQPFSQVDGSLTRKTGGTGLGLSICHHLIQMHGGRIGLTSVVDQGSTFYFTLPIQGLEEPEELDIHDKPELPDTAGLVWTPEHERNIKQGAKGKDSDQGERKKSVKPTEEGVHKDQDPAVSTLIIDNFELEVETYPDPMIGSETSSGYEEELLSGNNMILTIDPDHQVIDFYRRYLSSHGYTVIAVTELDQAISVARGIQPAAITLDISMRSSKVTNNGSLDGWAVLEALKSDPSTQNIPLVVCSLVDEREKAMKLGADEYLIKPILANDLATAINRLQNK